MRKFLTILGIFFIIMLSVSPVSAQETGDPVYIVQSGDTLSSIASRFNVSLNDLMAANNITDANLLAAGQQLVIRRQRSAENFAHRGGNVHAERTEKTSRAPRPQRRSDVVAFEHRDFVPALHCA